MKPFDPRLVRRSRTVRRQLVISVALGLVTAVALIAQAWLLSDLVAARFADRAVLAVPVAIASCLVLRAAVQWGHDVVAARAAATVKAELREEIVADLLDPRRLGPRPESSQVLTLLGPGLDAFDRYVGRFLPQAVLSALVPALVLAVVARTDWISAVIIGGTLPLIVVFMALVGLVTRDRIDRRWRALERLGRHFADVLDGLVVLKVFGRRQDRGLREVGERHRRETLRALRLAFLSSLVLELFSTLSVALVAVSVGLRVVQGDMALGAALFVLLLAPEAFAPLRQLGAQFHDSTEGAEAAAAALTMLEHGRSSGELPPPGLRHAVIDIDRVVVRHPDRRRASLRTAHERVAPGEFVAVTGPSGSGKSTLLSLLLGFERPAEGCIRIDGTDLTAIDVARWREQIAWVPQVPGLIEGTIEHNVRLSSSAASRQDVRRALADAGAADLPLDRWISESGDDISAGERRRIAIARALVRLRVGGAHLLLLDEPTAGLDAEREQAVLSTLRGLDATIVVVTHRADSIRAADRVLDLRIDSVVPA